MEIITKQVTDHLINKVGLQDLQEPRINGDLSTYDLVYHIHKLIQQKQQAEGANPDAIVEEIEKNSLEALEKNVCHILCSPKSCFTPPFPRCSLIHS